MLGRPILAWQASSSAPARAFPTLARMSRWCLLRAAPRRPPTASAPATGGRRAAAFAAVRVASCSAVLAGAAGAAFPRRAGAAAASRCAAVAATPGEVSLLGQADAIALDQDLMDTPGFSVDQLMELAGLSVAAGMLDAFPLAPSDAAGGGGFGGHRRVLLVCGPGNNGGDGLVAARHLYHFGYEPTVVYPKRSKGQLFTNLVTQCEQLGISVLSAMPVGFVGHYDVIVDAIFGFSFKGQPRAPFDRILADIKAASPTIKVLSVDIPSGWDVEQGPASGDDSWQPDVLVSLTAPKLAAKVFAGRHYLGGRFVPPGIVQKYHLRLPRYPGASQVVELKGWGSCTAVGSKL